jgi:ubiquinone/menaquinone biosynthesis C-methylase UbiE
MTETFNLSLEQAHAYEELFVPALFAQWVPTLLQAAGVARGQRVLDVACGTGVVARQAAGIVGQTGRVSGIDLNPAMIEVAREVSREVDPSIVWTVGDAADLPYDDESFNAVVCQSALFFFPDPALAIAEMARVLEPAGSLALQTYAALDEQPAYGRFVEIAARHAGREAHTLLGTYWSQGDVPNLQGLLEAAALEPGQVISMMGHLSFPSLEAFVHTEIEATPLATYVDHATYHAIVAETSEELAEYVQPDTTARLPIGALFVTGSKRDPSAEA